MESWLSFSNKGISYSCVARYYLCGNRALTATIKIILYVIGSIPILQAINFAVSSTGRAKDYECPDTYTRMADWQTRWSQTPLSQDVRVRVPL